MKLLSAFFLLLFLFSCSNSKKAVKDEKETTKPILETDQIATLTNEQQKIIKTTITSDIQRYTQSCKKKKVGKLNFDRIAFLKILDKNPSEELLHSLNENFSKNRIFSAAKNGVYVSRGGLLMGFKDKNNDRKGYLYSVTSIKSNQDSTISVSIHKLYAALGGVAKSYKISKSNPEFEIINCKVDFYN